MCQTKCIGIVAIQATDSLQADVRLATLKTMRSHSCCRAPSGCASRSLRGSWLNDRQHGGCSLVWDIDIGRNIILGVQFTACDFDKWPWSLAETVSRT